MKDSKVVEIYNPKQPVLFCVNAMQSVIGKFTNLHPDRL